VARQTASRQRQASLQHHTTGHTVEMGGRGCGVRDGISIGTPPCDRYTLVCLPLLHWMAGHGEVYGVSGGPGRFSATEIQDILENPSI
jgi:hypothetical protein